MIYFEYTGVCERDLIPLGLGMASPLNARWGSFCSAFADTDAPFGSLGSFFAFRPVHAPAVRSSSLTNSAVACDDNGIALLSSPADD
jgi:hypothetical protein